MEATTTREKWIEGMEEGNGQRHVGNHSTMYLRGGEVRPKVNGMNHDV
jgi:hypothetical protein